MADYDENKLYAITMPRKQYVDDDGDQSPTQTVIVKPYPEMDGGMVGFRDPDTGGYVGCCGINHWKTNAREVTFA